MSDIPELTEGDFARSMRASVRSRLTSGIIESGEDIAALRRFVGFSQKRFAEAMGISVHTLRNWEQGRRTPEGPALALLRLAARHPRLIRNQAGSNPDVPTLPYDLAKRRDDLDVPHARESPAGLRHDSEFPISRDDLDRIRRNPEEYLAWKAVRVGCLRWARRSSGRLDTADLEDVVSEAIVRALPLILDPMVETSEVNRKVRAHLGSARRSRVRSKHGIVPIEESSLVERDSPRDVAFRRIEGERLLQIVRAARRLIPRAIEQCGSPYSDHLIELFQLERLGLRRHGAKTLAEKKPTARRRALRRALSAFSNSLEVILEARKKKFDPDLYDEVIRFLRGEVGVNPGRVLMEIHDATTKGEVGPEAAQRELNATLLLAA